MNQHAAQQDQVRRFYDCEAESYDASRYQSRRGQRRDRFHKDLLLRLLKPAADETRGGRKILEVGCGTGRFLETLAAAGYPVAGTDLSAGMLEQARQRLDAAGCANVELTQTSTLPFPEGTFAAVYSIFVVNLIPDFEQLFAGVAKVLAPGGLFVFNVPNLSSVYWPVGTVINWRRRTSTRNAVGARYSHWFSRREWRRSLASCGFQVETVFGEPPWCGAVDRCAPTPGSSPFAWVCKSLFIQARLIRTEKS